MSCRLESFFFRMDFVVGIWIEAAEAVLAGTVSVGAAYDVCAGVLEEDDAFGDEILGLVHHDSVHGAKLGFAFGVLLRGGGCARQREDCRDKKKSFWHLHFFSPPAGSIRNTIRASLTPVLASSARV